MIVAVEISGNGRSEDKAAIVCILRDEGAAAVVFEEGHHQRSARDDHVNLVVAIEIAGEYRRWIVTVNGIRDWITKRVVAEVEQNTKSPVHGVADQDISFAVTVDIGCCNCFWLVPTGISCPIPQSAAAVIQEDVGVRSARIDGNDVDIAVAVEISCRHCAGGTAERIDGLIEKRAIPSVD